MRLPEIDDSEQPIGWRDQVLGWILVIAGLVLFGVYAQGQLEHTLRFVRQLFGEGAP